MTSTATDAAFGSSLLPVRVSTINPGLEYCGDQQSAVQAYRTLAALRIQGMAIRSESRPKYLGGTSGTLWEDPTQRVPLVLAVTAVASCPGLEKAILTFVFDLRCEAVSQPIRLILGLAETIAVHGAANEYATLQQIGIELPSAVFDTEVAQRLLHLGSHYAKFGDDSFEADSAKRKAAFAHSLVGACVEHGVPFPRSKHQDRLARQIEQHNANSPLPPLLIEWVGEYARVALAVWEKQVSALHGEALLRHAMEVEMPMARILAEMGWLGFQIDPDASEKLGLAKHGALAAAESRLASLCVVNANNVEQVRALVKSAGLGNALRRNGKISTQSDDLKPYAKQSPQVAAVLEYRRIQALTSTAPMNGDYVCSDGRVRPTFQSLASATGRTHTTKPNAQGIPSIARPLILADPGHQIASLDFAQQEVGIVAALSGDETLIDDFNRGDVYVAAAKRLFESHCDRGDAGLSDAEYRNKHPNARARAKPLTLGIIYAKSVHSIAAELETSTFEAKSLMNKFFDAYPRLHAYVRHLEERGKILGYAQSVSGLRRHQSHRGVPSQRDLRQHRNTPVQASGADVIKRAMLLAHPLLKTIGGRVLLPMHDALVLQAPDSRIEDAIQLTRAAMAGAMRFFFPVLRPRVSVTGPYPCWCKDHPDELSRFIRSLRDEFPHPDQ